MEICINVDHGKKFSCHSHHKTNVEEQYEKKFWSSDQKKRRNKKGIENKNCFEAIVTNKEKVETFSLSGSQK